MSARNVMRRSPAIRSAYDACRSTWLSNGDRFMNPSIVWIPEPRGDDRDLTVAAVVRVRRHRRERLARRQVDAARRG